MTTDADPVAEPLRGRKVALVARTHLGKRAMLIDEAKADAMVADGKARKVRDRLFETVDELPPGGRSQVYSTRMLEAANSRRVYAKGRKA